MPRRPVIGVMGSGEAPPSVAATAAELGELLAGRGWVVLCGGRPEGVMGAVCAGAKRVSGSLTVGIMPSASGGVGPDVDLAVFTGMGEARNAINVLSSDVVVACGTDGAGTASEIALALKAGKAVILLSPSAAGVSYFRSLPARGRLLEAWSAVEAVRIIEEVLGIPPGETWSA